jgi:hypothetical protein
MAPRSHGAAERPDDVTERFGGDPGFGLYLVLTHVAQQLRNAVNIGDVWSDHGALERPTSDAPQNQHEGIVAEIPEEYPDAAEQELELRGAIREHVAVAMAPQEEDETYDRLVRLFRPSAWAVRH